MFINYYSPTVAESITISGRVILHDVLKAMEQDIPKPVYPPRSDLIEELEDAQAAGEV